jgi:hypothetical protein
MACKDERIYYVAPHRETILTFREKLFLPNLAFQKLRKRQKVLETMAVWSCRGLFLSVVL